MAVKPRGSVPEGSAPVSEVLATLSTGQKVKRRILHMRACNEKDEKGKLCCGHLKRFFAVTDEVKKQYGDDAEVYRCERCKTLYVPAVGEAPRTRSLAF